MKTIKIAFAILMASVGSYALAAEVTIDGKKVTLPYCGGFAGLACSDNDWCDFPQEAACGVGDQLGRCRTRPEVCTQEFVPVCGCDGETYSNFCRASANGMDVAYVGVCRGPSGKPAG